jgi:hypothetical protein
MVAYVTGYTPDFIEMELPYAQGLQYQATCIEFRWGAKTAPLTSQFDKSKTWREIAGL